MNRKVEVMNPIHQGLDTIGEQNDSAVARVFGVTRQAVANWRRNNSIPKHFIRTFASLSGISVDELLEFDELLHGVHYEQFKATAAKALREELVSRE